MTRIAPTADDTALPEEPRLRSPHDLGVQLAALRHRPGTGPTGEYYRGAAAGLTWLLDGGPGPVTGDNHAGPVTILAVLIERAHAGELLHADPPRHYLVGFEHALLWAIHDTTVAPLPADYDTAIDANAGDAALPRTPPPEPRAA